MTSIMDKVVHFPLPTNLWGLLKPRILPLPTVVNFAGGLITWPVDWYRPEPLNRQSLSGVIKVRAFRLTYKVATDPTDFTPVWVANGSIVDVTVSGDTCSAEYVVTQLPREQLLYIQVDVTNQSKFDVPLGKDVGFSPVGSKFIALSKNKPFATDVNFRATT